MNYALFDGKRVQLFAERQYSLSIELKALFLFCLLISGTQNAYSQAVASCPPVVAEICDNNIDDDGDGLTDCADPDCYLNAACGETLTCPVDVLYVTEEFPVGDGIVISDVWEDNAIVNNNVDIQFAIADPDGFTLSDGTPLPGHANATDRGDDITDIPTLGFLDSDIDGSVIPGEDGETEPAVIDNAGGREAAKQTTFLIVPPNATCIDFRVNPARDDNGRLYLGINSTSMEVVVGGTGTGGLTGSYTIPGGVQGVTSSCGVFWPVLQARFYHVDQSAFSNTTVQWDLNDGEGFQDIDPIYFTSDIAVVAFVENQRMLYRDADNVRLFDAGGQVRDELNPLFCEPGTEEICVTDSGPFCECELQDANSTVFGWNAFGNPATPGTMPFTNTCGNEESNYTLGVTGNATLRTNANNLIIGNQAMAVGECTQVTLNLETATAPKFYIRDIDTYDNIGITGTLNGVVVKPIILTRNRRSIVGVGVAADPSIAGQITADATNLRALSRRNYGAAGTINSVEVYFTGPIDQLIFDVCKTNARSYNLFVTNFETCCENTVALCNDAVDNDGDGVADCDDPKCQGLAQDCFIPCPVEDRAPIRTWNLLSAEDRMTLETGGTVMDHPTGFCDPDGGDPVTVNITSGPAPDAPDPTVINANRPGPASTQSFRLGRSERGTAGVQYCYDFSTGTNFLIDSRQHVFFARSENIVITASFQGSPVDLIGEWGNPGNVQTATITGNNTDKVTFSANGQRRRLWWRLGSVGDEPIDEFCIQYFRTNPNEIPGNEHFRFQMCGDVCPDFVEEIITCDDPQPISRWNRLTIAQRDALDDGDETTNAEEFDSGFCNADGTPFYMDIETSAAQNSADQTTINNRTPRRAGYSSYLAARSTGGASGAENCFQFEEAVPFRVDSRDHRCFNGTEFITVTAFNGVDPVVLTGGYNGVEGAATVTGDGTTEMTFAANGRAGCGLWWEVSSVDAPITRVCVQYYRSGGAPAGAEPFRLSICNTDRCVFDDPFAIAERDLGDGDLLADLPANTLPDQLGVAKSISGIEQAASGVPGNVDLTFRIIARNNGNSVINNLQLIDDIENAISPAAFVGFVTATVVEPATNAATNPTVNPAYDGIIDAEVLVGTDGTLNPGQRVVVDVVFEVDASALLPNTQFTNAALVTGTAPDGSLATGSSDSGASPNGTNPNEVGDTGGAIDATPVYVPAMNATKDIINVYPVQATQAAGNLNVQFELTLENTGNVDLTNLQLVDDLRAQFGTAFIDISFIQYAEITASTATTNPVLNGGFNDQVFESNIFDGMSGLLEPGQSITVQFTAEINPNADNAPESLSNQVSASGNGVDPVGGGILNDPNTGVPYVATDLSDSGNDPNSTNPNAPGDTGGHDDPTSLDGRLPSLGSAKTASNVVAAPTAGNQYVTFQIVVANSGNAPLSNVQVTDNVAQQLGDVFIGYVSGPLIVSSTAAVNPGVNSEFDAFLEPNIFNGTSGLLQPGQMLTVSFVVEVNPALSSDPMSLTNQAEVSADAPNPVGGGFISVTDLTDSGTNPESNNLGSMGDTGGTADATPIFGDFPLIVQAPMDITIESYGVGNTPLNDWIENNGYLIVITPDECQPAVVTNDYTEDSFVSDCSPYSGSATVNFFYSDACGNSYDFSATFTLEDNTAPSCVKPADLTIACDDPDFEATVSSYAAYWGPVTDLSHPITIESTYSEDGFDENGQQTIVWTFTDACGNSRSWDAVLTVTGDCTPMLTVEQPADLNLDCAETVPAAGVVATTTCAGGVINVVDSEVLTSMGCAGMYTLVRTYEVSDECGNSQTVSQTITVTDNTAPVFSFVPADASVDCSGDMSGFGTPTADDACGSVTISSDDTTNGGDVCSGGATVTRTWTATDECGNATTASQTLTLSADNVAPTFTFVPADATITCPAMPVFGTPTATDACNDVTITEAITATGACPDAYTTTITWTATDACGNATTASQTITVNPEVVAPVLTVTPPTNYNLDCTEAVPAVGVVATTTCPDGLINVVDSEVVTPMGCPGSFTIVRTYNVSDNCGNSEVVTQTIAVVDNTTPVFTFVPAGGDVDCTAYPDGFGTPVASDACGSVTVTFEDNLAPYICDADFNITRTWTATDECGNVATASQTLTVWPDVEAPTFTFVPGNTTVTCGQAVEFGTPDITDTCTGFTLTEEVTATGACPDAYTTTKTWTAVDGCGNASVQSQTITVLAAPAPIALGFTFVPENKFVECGDVVEFGEPICAGNCADGFSINVEDFTTVSEICANTQVMTRRWTATDACDNAAIAEQVITIIDTTAPEFTNVPADKVVACGDAIIFNEPVALDLCGGITLTFEEEIEWANCEGVAYSVTRNWTAADACGNTTTFANTISVEEDATAPVLSTLEDKVVTCSEGITFDTPVATDNCDDVVLSYSDEVSENGCEIVHTRTWIAADGCNNAAETVQEITVIDDVEPTFNIESNSILMSLFAYQNWTAPEVVAFDECSNVQAEGPFVLDNGNGRIDYLWTTSDACGNKVGVTLTVNIIANDFPVGVLEGTTLSVFPNPTGGKLTLDFGVETEGTATIIVMDVLGRTYLTQKAGTYVGQNVVRLDLGDLPQGTYLVKVNDGVQELTETFIKF